VSCGKAHTVLLVERNQRNFLYSFGSNKTGQLGIGKNIQFSVEPQLIDCLPSAKIDSIASAKNSSFVLFENGTLYSWGGNKEGILGIGSYTGAIQAGLGEPR
jgi:alpha-tubulin suppressor-like RCC1 family protein